MADTCAYRYGANQDAARAAYEHYTEAMGAESPQWDDLEPAEQELWKGTFVAGHRAYRMVIRDENRGLR